ncbi:hypothetical protein A6P39_45420 [Streptomyces sp. FXJ1.172]|uniref:hypothetical protein n=1 Tax=Streptomyces sp. FXJ1.172 TaxID=710705 RepID=UPI002F3FF5A0
MFSSIGGPAGCVGVGFALALLPAVAFGDGFASDAVACPPHPLTPASTAPASSAIPIPRLARPIAPSPPVIPTACVQHRQTPDSVQLVACSAGKIQVMDRRRTGT